MRALPKLLLGLSLVGGAVLAPAIASADECARESHAASFESYAEWGAQPVGYVQPTDRREEQDSDRDEEDGDGDERPSRFERRFERGERGDERLEHRGERFEHRGDRFEHRGDRFEHRGERFEHGHRR